MKKLKGPDLKMPDLKVPGFLSDLYYDLRDRRLLPLVGLVLVAIVAVPFLLSGGADETRPPRIEPPAEGVAVNASQLTVVPATPGLRDYRQRLRGRSPKDPFKKPPVPTATGGELGSKGDNGFEQDEVTSSTTSTQTTKTDTTETSRTTKSKDGEVVTETTTETSEEPADEGKGASQTALSTYAIDVKIKTKTTAADGTAVTKTFNRTNLLAPTALPGKKTQVVTYMGISPQTQNPMFLVSEEVTSVFGEGTCLAGTEACQLLEVEKGMPTTFVFGEAEDSYKITVTKVHPFTAKGS